MISPEVVERAIGLLRRTADYEYFFNHLTSPDWIVPLKEKGFFTEPPEPQEEDGYIWFPPWPESHYLMRVSSKAPETVLRIALDMPETKNVRVQEDLIGAALEMPPELSSRLADRVAAWLQAPYLLLPSKASSLVSHIARGGQVEKALAIARELLRVVPGRALDTEGDKVLDLPWRPEPEARIDTWEYEQFVKTNLPDLVEIAPQETLSLLSELLNEALMLKKSADTPSFADYSQVWRPAIEPHPQNIGSPGLKELLVTAVRDTAAHLIEVEPRALRTVVDDLEARSWTVFRRIGLYLVSRFGELDIELVTSKLSDKTNFEDPGLRHEYATLAREHFGDIEAKFQEEILAWIESGPDQSKYIERIESEEGIRPTSEQMQLAGDYWRLRWLAILKDSLPEEWRRTYDALVEKHGEPERPDLLVWSSGVRVGPTSPKSPEQIEEMPIDELAAFLGKWEPPQGFMMDSPEGLSRAITEAVSKNPGMYANEAGKFKGIGATYVRGVVAGLRNATENAKSFPWIPVLDLCEWVTAQPRDNTNHGSFENGELDPHWGWARNEVARLLEEGLKSESNQIQFDLRDAVWRVLSHLTDDPDPTSDYEKEYGGSDMDPATLSINTTRGAALHTTIRYVIWCQVHLVPSDPETENRQLFSLGQTPEAREVLEAHLDISEEKSLAVHSVYGWWFASLILLDQEWTIGYKRAIFPIEEELRPYFEAAWHAFVRFNRPTTSLLEALHDEYRLALEDSAHPSDQRGWAGDPHERLVEHLMIYCWWGDLHIESELLQMLWSRAPERMRRHALTFVGQSLYRTTEDAPSAVVQRLMKLWEARMESVLTADPKELYGKEMGSFGWWFSSGKLDDLWSLEQLREVLKQFGEVDAAHLVVKRLASMAGTHPEDAVALLAALVDGDTKGWRLHAWRDSAMMLLEKALISGNHVAVQAAEDLIHRLGARGHLEYGDLLS